MPKLPDHMKYVYERHLSSPQWKAIREKALEKAFWKGAYHCQVCEWDFPKDKLQVHHRHYKTLGRETLIDLLVVCERCHKKEDFRRAKEAQERSEIALFNAGLDTWATKKYDDEDWRSRLDADEIAQEYEEWLQEKEWF